MAIPQSYLSERNRRREWRGLLLFTIPAFLIAAFVLRAIDIGRAGQAALTVDDTAPKSVAYEEVQYRFGRGYIGEDWQLYFNQPDAGAERADYVGGIEDALAASIDKSIRSLDIAAFELNSDAIFTAILRAHRRGVTVRIVTDDKHGLEDARDSAIRDLQRAGIPVVDDGRAGLMHNKFIIVDGRIVWTGSWNLTVNGSYRNNNNALVLDDSRAARAYQDEFEEMFLRGEFGPRSSDDGVVSFRRGDGEVSIIFASEADELSALIEEIARAESAIRFMVFVFSLDELAEAMLQQTTDPAITIQGIFEKRNSTASWSQLPALHCAGAAIRQDGNRYILHHKVIILDEDTVITGSFNYSGSAANRNDENIIIIRDAAIAALYLDEWRRMWDGAEELAPDEVVCD